MLRGIYFFIIGHGGGELSTVEINYYCGIEMKRSGKSLGKWERKYKINNLCYLICLRHLIWSRVVANRIFSLKIPISPHACVTLSELQSNISNMPGKKT